MTQRNYAWQTPDGSGLERLQLQSYEQSQEVDTSLIGRLEGQDFSGSYWLRLDRDWTVRQLRIRLQLEKTADDQPTRRAALEVQHDGQGNWLVEGENRPDLAGCLDVDLTVTPFTNSPPVMRHDWRKGESRDFRMVFIAPSFDPTTGQLCITAQAKNQRYTCLAPLGSAKDGGGLFRYQGLDSGFDCDLSFDADGVVLTYPDTFLRIDPQ
ncbi:putative glycolipid-binding domain-containing protein [Rhodovibrionaceae bacterium A322]